MVFQLFNGKVFSTYGVFGCLGFVLGMAFLALACRIKKIKFDDAVYVYVWAGGLAIVGAKVLYLLLDIGNIVAAFRTGGEYLKAYMNAVLSGGMVFYGGLAGGMLGVILAAKFFRLDRRTMLSVSVPALPLAHAFGRLGCHTVGCCYGIPVHGRFAKIYTDSAYAPNNVKLFPVQLTESICDIVIFLVLAFILFGKRTKDLKESSITEWYLLMYPTVRFGLEFLRGDVARGHFLIFSTSQWISMIIFIAALTSLILRKKKHKAD